MQGVRYCVHCDESNGIPYIKSINDAEYFPLKVPSLRRLAVDSSTLRRTQRVIRVFTLITLLRNNTDSNSQSRYCAAID